ncbi:bifunctional helix-turn-helix transcriptional regulator/GNAT family N-acetyltransferase [Pendulispora brunnea]|uniref:Bifunctional helix-turn-helix transcriptional regulator/GNAT family N-acetyltransferase n=1 Tax=Pendulispora brunnea TaxID=2905690 RepID=A0ABZ2K1H8_9BACT
MSTTLFPEVLPLRYASRSVVRELGFLQDRYDEAGVSHSEAHALMEIESKGPVAPISQADLSQALGLDKSTTSRIVARLVEKGWVRAPKDKQDARRSVLLLTAAGRKRLGIIHGPANSRVQEALGTLSEEERSIVLFGMNLYARALRATRLQEEFRIRPIARKDNGVLSEIIGACLAEFSPGTRGLVDEDPEFHSLYEFYRKPRSAYFVIEREQRVLGGAGVAPLKGGDAHTCEFQKMYLLAECRGHGLGQRMLDMCMRTAKEFGYRRAYLETLTNMNRARKLYEKNGFMAIPKQLGTTGHYGSEAWYVKEL